MTQLLGLRSSMEQGLISIKKLCVPVIWLISPNIVTIARSSCIIWNKTDFKQIFKYWIMNAREETRLFTFHSTSTFYLWIFSTFWQNLHQQQTITKTLKKVRTVITYLIRKNCNFSESECTKVFNLIFGGVKNIR